MKKLIAVIVVAIISGCATAPTLSIEEKRKRKTISDEAVRNSISCGNLNIGQVDDGISDATTIAMALAASCHKEYSNSVEAFIASQVDENENVKRLLRNKLNTRESKIETYLSIVTKYRNTKNQLKNDGSKDHIKDESQKIQKSI